MYYLELRDVVAIASAVLGVESELLLQSGRVNLANSAVHAPAASYGGVEMYPGLPRKVGVLGYRLVRNHPFLDGNKRVAFLAMVEMVERNGHDWTEPADDVEGDETVAMMLGAAAGEIDELSFVTWVGSRIR